MSRARAILESLYQVNEDDMIAVQTPVTMADEDEVDGLISYLADNGVQAIASSANPFSEIMVDPDDESEADDLVANFFSQSDSDEPDYSEDDDTDINDEYTDDSLTDPVSGG